MLGINTATVVCFDIIRYLKNLCSRIQSAKTDLFDEKRVPASPMAPVAFEARPPLLRLPIEVICGHIIPHLPLSTRYALASTCRHFSGIVFDNPLTWQTIDLTGPGNFNLDVNRELIRLLNRRLSTRSIHSIRSVTAESTYLTRRGLACLLENCPNLCELNLNDCMTISMRDIATLLRKYPVSLLHRLSTRHIPCSKETVVQVRKLLLSRQRPRFLSAGFKPKLVQFDRHICDTCTTRVAMYKLIACGCCRFEQVYICEACNPLFGCYTCKTRVCRQCARDPTRALMCKPCRRCHQTRMFCQRCNTIDEGRCGRCPESERVTRELDRAMRRMSMGNFAKDRRSNWRSACFHIVLASLPSSLEPLPVPKEE
ncbi:hypothetical protein BC937DRAFT_88716 [Endogone sp. FLAS-F59071]|nr:hypothetical protein BC937DRAFT_88716 [Endogone sp. FLAS-F59071]|eukprot:RUS22503.1 hypothetical protein BC937DRAFT_88716 [Endogone sp. FLAS-F59071]